MVRLLLQGCNYREDDALIPRMRTTNVIHPNGRLGLPTWRYYYYGATFLFVAWSFILHYVSGQMRNLPLLFIRRMRLTPGAGGGELMWRGDRWHISTRRQQFQSIKDVSQKKLRERHFLNIFWTLKPPMRWSLLNSLPFLYHFRVGVGLPLAWHRNFTVLLAGTAWSFFSIFSGWAHCGAIATEEDRRSS